MLCERKITQKVKVAVIGLGYVGLPLLTLAGQKGYRVLGIDADEGKVAGLQAGQSYISGVDSRDIRELIASASLCACTGFDGLPHYDVIVICVPTPLTQEKKPDYTKLLNAAESVSAVLRKGQLVVVESTVAPGTTLSTVMPVLEKSGLKAGTDFFLAYSPERIDPGNQVFTLQNTPKLVAGYTPECCLQAQDFYRSLGITVIPVESLAVAEMAKLLENTYRDINIAFINEMAQICLSSGINIWDVIEAAATKPFGFQAFYPGPGVGGHCIPVDSVYYSYWARESGMPATLAEYARSVNAGMPRFITGLVRSGLQNKGKPLSGSKILVLGVTYKKGSSDIRESPAVELIELLRKEGADVLFHDPFVNQLPLGSGELQSTPLNEQTVSGQDCVVLTVAHSAYDLGWLYNHSPLLVDLTNKLAGFPPGKVVKL